MGLEERAAEEGGVTPVELFDLYADRIIIEEPVGKEVERKGVVRLRIEDGGPSGATWIGNRDRLRALIEKLEAWEALLPPEVPS